MLSEMGIMVFMAFWKALATPKGVLISNKAPQAPGNATNVRLLRYKCTT